MTSAKRQELERRVAILESLTKKIREIIAQRQAQAGPQSDKDSHTEATWQGKTIHRNNGNGV